LIRRDAHRVAGDPPALPPHLCHDSGLVLAQRPLRDCHARYKTNLLALALPVVMESTLVLRRKSSGRMASKGFPDQIDIHIGKRVRSRRTIFGLSQTALGEVLGLTFQQILNMKSRPIA
jgi:hypothetical protein